MSPMMLTSSLLLLLCRLRLGVMDEGKSSELVEPLFELVFSKGISGESICIRGGFTGELE